MTAMRVAQGGWIPGAREAPRRAPRLLAGRRELLWAALGFVALLLALLACLALLAPAARAAGTSDSVRTAADARLDLDSFDWIWSTIRDKHYDPALGGLDWQAVRDSLRPLVERAETRAAARAVMRRMILLLGESHFQVIPGHVLEAMGRRPGPGSPGGTTGMDVRVVHGRALVVSVAPGSPADSAGVRPGWEVLRAGGEDLAPLIRVVARASRVASWRDLDLASVALGRLEGAIGDTVAARFRDGRGRRVEVALRLAEKPGWLTSLGPVHNVRVLFEARRLPGNVGYVAFNSFMDPSRLMPAFEAAVRDFADADGIVLDLRGNQGGMIPIAAGMTGWLVAEKDLRLGTFRFRDGELKAVVNPRLGAYAGPVAVLVDGLSVSCAEALAGGLQDLGRARLFGTRTAGMVLGSAVERLPNGDGFQYVFASYRSARGRLLEGRGVVPDVEAPPTRRALLRGSDPALDAAVKWIHHETKARGEAGPATPSRTNPAAAGR